MIKCALWTSSIKARLHDAIFAYNCCMQLADAIPATLCLLSRRYDYCMRLFQPRDILDPLSSFFFKVSWSHFEQEAYQFRFLSFTVDVRHFELFFHQKCMPKSQDFKTSFKFFTTFLCSIYDCRKQVVGLSTRHDSCRRDGVSKFHTTIVSKNRIV
jgi:hypothetical protein